MYINKIKTIRSRSTLGNKYQSNSLEKMFKNQYTARNINHATIELRTQFPNVNIYQIIKKGNLSQTLPENNQFLQTIGKTQYEKTKKLHNQAINPTMLPNFHNKNYHPTLYQVKRKNNDKKYFQAPNQNIQKDEFVLSGTNNFQVAKPYIRDISKTKFYRLLQKDQEHIFARASDFKFQRGILHKLSIKDDKKANNEGNSPILNKFLSHYKSPKASEDNSNHNFKFRQNYKIKNTIYKHRYYNSLDFEEHRHRNSFSPWQNLGETKGQWQYKNSSK